MEFSKNVKRIRNEKGYSLNELADKSQVSRAMLSKIERGEKQPTLKVASQIAEALDSSISKLVGENERQKSILTKRGKHSSYKDPITKFERTILSPAFSGEKVEVILNKIPPKSESGRFSAHKRGVIEHIFVVSGMMRVELAHETFEMDVGDSLYFEANQTHQFINDNNENCEYILVIDSSSM